MNDIDTPEQSDQNITPNPPIIGRDVSGASGDTDQAEVSQVFPPSKPRKNRRLIVGIVFLIVLTTAGGILAWAYLRDQKPTNSNTVTKKDIPLLRVGVLLDKFDVGYPKAPNNTVTTIELTNQLFEGLVRYEDLTKLKPSLATGWVNPDSSTWVFTLKRNVQFHTGRTMTALDVAYSIDALKNSGSESAELYTDTIQDVEAIDNYKVKITTKSPDPILLNKLAYVYIIDSRSDKQNDPVNGTGPYVVKPGSVPTSERLDLVAFDKYHGGHVYTRALNFSVHKDEVQLAQDLKNGKFDIAGDFSSIKETALFKNKAQLLADQGAWTSMLGIRTSRDSPVAIKEVRQAIALLVDRESIIDKAGVNADPAFQLIPTQIPGHNPNVKPYERDIVKAKQLLADAGYPNGLTLTGLYTDDRYFDEIKKQLAEGGIIVNATIDTSDDYYTKILNDKVDLFILGYASSFGDGIDFLTEMSGQFPGYEDENFVGILNDINTEFNASKRLQLLQKASQAYGDEVVSVPLFSPIYTNVIPNKTYVIKQDISAASRGVYYYKVYAK
jgi:peptide/nickel transport system substrate-binding protein